MARFVHICRCNSHVYVGGSIKELNLTLEHFGCNSHVYVGGSREKLNAEDNKNDDATRTCTWVAVIVTLQVNKMQLARVREWQ